MELYAAVRRSVYVEGLSERAAARRFGLARETVRKMRRYRLPPGYRRAQPIRRPKLDAFTGVIDQILREDQSRPTLTDGWPVGRKGNTNACGGIAGARSTGYGPSRPATRGSLPTGACCIEQRLDGKSRMSGDVHVRFRERLGVRFPGATRLNG